MDYIFVAGIACITATVSWAVTDYFYNRKIEDFKKRLDNIDRIVDTHVDSSNRFFATKAQLNCLEERISLVARHEKDSFECVANLSRKINEVTQRCNAMQDTLNLIKPLTSFIRAKDATEKTGNSHKLNVARTKELKKAAADLIG